MNGKSNQPATSLIENVNLSPIEKKLAKLEEQKQALLSQQREQRRKVAKIRVKTESTERKSWEGEVARSLRRFYPMPASEIAERLDTSINKQNGEQA
jgi:hypothetical protein